MASIWKLDGQDLYVDQYSRNPKGTIAELNPLNSTASIYHFIFQSDDEINFQGTVIGETFEANVRSTWGNEVTLITDLVSGGFTVQIMQVQSVRQPSMSQHVDRTQDITSPVYRITVVAKVV